MMTFQAFIDTKNQALPPNVNDFLLALWHDAKGNWHAAHEVAQKAEGTYDYDRIHSYLHRKEGDDFNARYWYRRIGLVFPSISLEQEWEQLVQEYLEK